MWKNENPNYNSNNWEDYKRGDSAMSTAATSIEAATKLIKLGLDSGYTHFTLKYPVSNYGIMKNEPKEGV